MLALTFSESESRPIVVIMPRELVYSFREYTLILNPVLVCEVQGSPQVPYGCGSYFLRSRRQNLKSMTQPSGWDPWQVRDGSVTA